jgi:hypothetical protein
MEIAMQLSPASQSRIIGIRFCEPGQVRIRKIVMRSRARATGKFPSQKLLRMMQWESINELNAFRLIECIPAVTQYAEQPCEITYLGADGQEARHYPDLLVTINGAKELWEVKACADAHSDEVRRRTEILMDGLPHLGFQYRIKLAENLAIQPRLDNACLLLKFGRQPITQVERWQFERLLEERPSLIWGEACAGTYGLRGREVLCRLVLDGVMSIEMYQPITDMTEFLAAREAHKWDI